MKLLLLYALGCLIYSLGVQYPSHASSLESLLSDNNYHKIQMRKLSTGHDIVSAYINGIRGLFVVDTGAISLINQSLESKYHLLANHQLNTFQAAGAVGEISIAMFSHKGMTLGNVAIVSSQIGSSDLSAVLQGLYNATGQPLDGIIGQDVLIASQAIIDAKNRHLFIQTEPASFMLALTQTMEDLGFVTIDLQPIVLREFNITFLTLTVNVNGVKALLLVDSGASTTMLDNARLSQFQLYREHRLSSNSRSGAGGYFGITLYQLNHFKLGQIDVNKPFIATANLSAVIDFIENYTGKKIDGVLGQDVLASLAAVINVASSQLYIRHN